MGLERPGASATSLSIQRTLTSLAAAMGHSYGPQPERGIFRTTDGGKTWDRVLFVDENTGASELVMDPTTRAIFLPACGRSRFIPGDEKAVDQAAAFTNRLTQTHLEKNHRPWTADAHHRQGGPGDFRVKSQSHLRAIETGDGVPVNGRKLIAASSGARTMAATTGAWSVTTARSADVRITTSASSPRPTMKTKPIS